MLGRFQRLPAISTRFPISEQGMAQKPRLMRLVGPILIAAALLLALYTAIAYTAWQSGRSLRQQRVQEERSTEVANQISHAQEEIEAGNVRLALRRLEWVLGQDPEHTRAQALREIAESALNQPGSPSQENEGATETPRATAGAGGSNEAAEAQLQEAEQLVEAERWQEAIRALVDFQHRFPDYDRRHTDNLLHQSYIVRGADLLYGEQVELGLYYLSLAEELGDLPQGVEDQRPWAQLYLAGMGYYGVNWDVALFYFRDLCLAAPFYQNSCQKLYEALVARGDQYAVQQDWCPARSLYAEAYAIEDPSSLAQKLGEAREACDAATPTAAAPITSTNASPLTATIPSEQDGFRAP